MKTYELKLIDGGRGVFRVSVVKDPAVESNLIFFNKESKEDVEHFVKDEEERVIYSVAMRPNKMIFRKNINGEPAQVYYTSETVKQAQENYFRNHGNLTTNINHSEHTTAQGIFPFESWVVKNSANDKSKELGLETIDGDWVMGYKVDNDEIWNKFIKTGLLDGLSIEATHIKHELIPETKMSKEKEELELEKERSFWDTLFGFSKQKIESFEKEKEEEKPIELVVEEKPEKPEEPKKEEEMVEEETPDVSNDLQAKINSLESENEALKTELATLRAEKVESEEKLQTMKKQTPASKHVIDAPIVHKKDYNEMNNFEKLKFNRENKF